MAEGSDSVSPSDATISDTDLETINTEELVIFNSTQTFYSNQKDIELLYTVGNAVTTTPTDWVGLFKNSWQTTYDFSAFQWAATSSTDFTHSGKCRLVFPQADIRDLLGIFQFLYVAGDRQVLGVSETFQVCCFDSATCDSTLSVHGALLPQSTSVISLGSLSSSSDEIEIVDVTAEKIDNIGEKNSWAEAPSFATVPLNNDNWTLSDFAVCSSTGDVYEKLRFASAWGVLNPEEEYEPLKQFYQSLRQPGHIIVEEIPCDGSLAPTDSSEEDKVSKEVVVHGRPSQSTMILHPNLPVTCFRPPDCTPLISLQAYAHSLMQSVFKEALKGITVKSQPFSYKSKPFFNKSESRKDTTTSSSRGLLPAPSRDCSGSTSSRAYFKPSVFIFKHAQAFTNSEHVVSNADHVTAPVNRAQKATTDTIIIDPSKAESPRAARDLRKKRWVQRSRIKRKREQHDVMLQEALSLLLPPSSPLPPATFTAAEDASSNTDSASSTTPSRQGAVSSRKRHLQTAPGITKFKRRRLVRHKSAQSLPANPCNSEDEGYSSGDDDLQKMIASSCHQDNLGLLSLALTEALKNNAELRQQISQGGGSRDPHTESKATVSTDVAGQQSASRYCSSSSTARNDTDTERKAKKRDVASNTVARSKRDAPSQVTRLKTRGQATNTEHSKKRHAASNTAAIAKKESRNQCQAAVTVSKSTSTAPVHSTEGLYSKSSARGKVQLSSQSSPAANSKVPASGESIKLDLTIRRPVRDNLMDGDPDNNLGKWQVVSAKKTARLQRLIARKKEEFARLRESAQNHEKHVCTLEANLQSVRSMLSAETVRRLKAERELTELRTKFWQLLASRPARPWGAGKCTRDTVVMADSGIGPHPAKAITFGPSVTPTPNTTSQERSEHKLQTKLLRDKEYASGTVPDLNPTEDKISISKPALEPQSHLNRQQLSSQEYHPLQATVKALDLRKYCGSATEKPATPLTCSVEEEVKVANGPSQTTEMKSSAGTADKTNTVSSEDVKKFINTSSGETRKVTSGSKERVKKSGTWTFGSKEETQKTASGSKRDVEKSTSSEEARTAMCSAISLKKLLIPAMTAIAETFGASKSKQKADARDEGTESTTASVTKVTVSISAGGSSPKVFKNKRKKASRSSSKEKNRVEVCNLPRQETSPNSSSDVTLRHRPTEKCKISEHVRMFTAPNELPVTKEAGEENGQASDESNKGDESKVNELKEASEWHPLRDPPKMCSHKEKDDINRVTGAQPLKFCFSKQQPTGAVDPVNYADATSGKFTRNHFARMIVTDGRMSQAHNEVTKPAIPLPDVVQRTPDNGNSIGRSVPPSSIPSYLCKPHTPNVVTTQPLTNQAVLVARDLAVHHHRHHQQEQHLHQQQPQPLPCPTHPRALHYDFRGVSSETVNRHVAQCVMCGMRFAPDLDRHLVEEHLHFHHICSG